MQFFTILATLFCGRTFWVAADYYVEYRAAPMITNARGHQVQTNYLYHCKGVPAGARAITAAGSRCALVTSFDQTLAIYFDCNFYNVHRPNPQGHLINLMDRGVMPNTDWNLGYENDAIDHPNFALPSEQDVTYFRNRLEILANSGVIPNFLVNGVARYLAQTNLISFSDDFAEANVLFNGFTTYLRRVVEKHRHIHEVAENLQVRRNQIDSAIKLALTKMIDPCSALHGNLMRFASRYCATYCNFLGVVARHFTTSLPTCSTLVEGHCQGVICMCTQRVVIPLAGCQTSRMQVCHNSIRSELHQ